MEPLLLKISSPLMSCNMTPFLHVETLGNGMLIIPLFLELVTPLKMASLLPIENFINGFSKFNCN